MAGRKRLDILVVEKGLAESRERAKALIMAGSVAADGITIDKPGKEIDKDAVIVVKEGLPYVSRGGIKLEGALKHFDTDVSGIKVMDVGASTGGFTDCLLQRGASKVFAVDVGRGIIDWRLRNDERVKVLEGRNIRHLQFDEVGEFLDMAVIDVSFISLKNVIPKVMDFVKDNTFILALIKPQFEVGRGMVGKGGIVKNLKLHQSVINDICDFAVSSGLCVKGIYESPIRGAKGNREFWICLKKNKKCPVKG